MIATETIIQSGKIKIKFPKCKHVEAASKCEVAKKVSRGDLSSGSSVEEKSSLSGFKRGPTGLINGQKQKRQKLDRAATVQCSCILKSLMSHNHGWIFNQPVDPVAMKIPDYFSIITNPMDLGTIKSKLKKSMYFDIEEFAADVRLTFANAMRYNPPANWVHVIANNLNETFEDRWKEIKKRVKRGVSKDGCGKSSKREMTESKCTSTKQDYCRTHSLQKDASPKKTLLFEEKYICGSFAAKDAKMDAVASSKASQKLVGKISNRGTYNSDRPIVCSVKADPSSKTLVPYKCSTCGGVKCCCHDPFKAGNLSSADASSERSQVCRPVSMMSPSLVSKCLADSDGGLSSLDDEFGSHLESPAVEAVPAEGWCKSVVDIQLSPQKALRAAMLKSRFAETILKAQQKTLLDNADRAHPSIIKQQEEKLKVIQLEEKAKIEAQMKAAEAALLMAEEESKKRREQQRQAARLELQQMEKTVDFEQNLEIWKELEMLCGFTRSCGFGMETGFFSQAHLRKPLQEIGLFIKDEHLEDDDKFLNKEEEGEEGEILS